MLKTKVREVKDAVREWVAALSIEELVVNQELVQIFESLERKLDLLERKYV